MSDFENETARKIRKKLDMEEIQKEEAVVNEEVKEEKTETEEDIFAIDKSQYELEPFEDSKEEVSKEEEKEVKDESSEPTESVVADVSKEVKKGNILSSIFGTTQPKTEHFKRKEKVRPLSLIVGILSLIVCAGIISVSLFAIIKTVPTVWGWIAGIAGFFFTETILVFSLGLGWALGGIIILMIGSLVLLFYSLFVLLSTVTIGIPIVAFSTFKQPKQVFAYNKDASGNMIFSYVLGVLISFFGFAIYMDGSFPPIAYISTLIVGIVFLIVAILLTIDIIQCKSYFKKYDNEKEKQEIIQEARDLADAKREKKRRKKFIGKIFSMMSRK